MATPGHAQHYCSRCGLRRARGGACDRDGTQLTQVIDSSLLGAEVGNYVIVKRLGEGGMGAVYRAIQPSIGAEVAIKVLHATAESHADAVQRFLLEAQAVNRVRHGNLLRIIDTGYLPDRRPYLVMELLDGITLAEAVGKLPFELACHVAAESLDALDAVHDEGIVHRDLKPANIFLARDGRVVVLDFGIAKLVTPDGTGPATKSGIIGTPEYMAPEQIRSWPIDRRTDVYAMGILLYETITGRRPFAAAATFDMLVQHLERPPTSPRDWIPALPNAIAEIILTALEKTPERRFQSARAMASALRATSTASRAALAMFVAERASEPAPIPIQTPLSPEPDPGESASGPTRRDLGAPTTPGRGKNDRVVRNTPTEEVRPPPPRRAPLDVEDDAGATLAARPSSARGRASEPEPATQKARRSPVLAILIAVGVAASAIVVALLVTRGDSAPATPATPPVEVPPTIASNQVTPVDAPPGVVPDAAALVGELVIDSTPSGAAVFVDGVARGTAPVTVSLSVGTHAVVLQLANYQSLRTVADVRVNVRTQLVLQLAAEPTNTTKSSRTKPRTGPGPTILQTFDPDTTGSAAPVEVPPHADAGTKPPSQTGTTIENAPAGTRKPNPF